jgi:hypothetical protein
VVDGGDIVIINGLKGVGHGPNLNIEYSDYKWFERSWHGPNLNIEYSDYKWFERSWHGPNLNIENSDYKWFERSWHGPNLNARRVGKLGLRNTGMVASQNPCSVAQG